MWNNLSVGTKNFILSFSVTLLIIISIAAILLTDYRCHAITTGISKPIISFYSFNSQTFADIYTLGIDTRVDITDCIKIWEFFMDLICLKV